MGAFGTNEAGVALESNVPGIHFNSLNNDGARKSMVTGFSGGIELNHITGTIGVYNSSASSTAGNIVGTSSHKMVIDKNGNVGIGINDPLSILHVNGSTKINDNSFLEFGDGLNKEINAGKIGYALFTPKTLDIVGSGLNTMPRKIRLWAEAVTEFAGNMDVFDTVRVRDLQNLASKANRAVTLDATGLLKVANSDVMYKTINVADFLPIPVGNSALDRISDQGTDLLLFRNTSNATFSGTGYFTYPLSKLPFGAKIVSVRVQYISKKPENSHTVSQLKARVSVSLYRQFVDPVFGGTSIKIPVVDPYDYTESTSDWKIPLGGLNVTGTTVNNPAGYITVDQHPTSLIVWSVAFASNGSPTTISDFKEKSYWPPNKALSFHSLIIGYKM